MQLAALSEIIEEPEFHRLLLADYSGPYSLGVIDTQKVLICLPDVPEAARVVPGEITFRGVHVVVEVRHDWAQPRKLA